MSFDHDDEPDNGGWTHIPTKKEKVAKKDARKKKGSDRGKLRPATLTDEPLNVNPSFFEDIAELKFRVVGTREETDRQLLAKCDDVRKLMRTYLPKQSWHPTLSHDFVAGVIGALQQHVWSVASESYTKRLGDDAALWDEERRLVAEPGGLRARAVTLQIPTTLLAKILLGGETFGLLCANKGVVAGDVHDTYNADIVSIARQCLDEKSKDYQTSTLLISSARVVDCSDRKEGGAASVSRGACLEERLASYLTKEDIKFRREQDFEVRPGTKRPDFLLDDPKKMLGIEKVKWIEAKSSYLWPGYTAQPELDYVLDHIKGLYEQRGPGLVLWGCAGWHATMEERVRANGVPADKVKFVRFNRVETTEERHATVAKVHG
eukprot:CAMPEP_0170737558 /NCGR_PEP_ID=MMETSP0437-20130122/4187_1 /TAXON_ID=0 /ORGANISM="Sexangularia sp." /LENGTH=376 /DNA_ID=CAMNT_0011075945 /DNA_START=70 /DNA_END=1200 /DNA_ORIENTATION=+